MTLPIVVLCKNGDVIQSLDCRPIIKGMLAVGAYCDHTEQVIRHVNGRRLVISPFKLGDEVVATVMVG